MFYEANDLLKILRENGEEGRRAGGCVRDYLMGLEPKDIDIATTARPERVIEIFEAAGMKVYPTGLQHGTVTVSYKGVPYEITTLRTDVKTDGRHAEVQFINDWALDAQRRDFTINALYIDEFYKVHDYVDGWDDIKNPRRVNLRFVGVAEDRIKEDYLRILRYFRFAARFKAAMSDTELDAIRKNAEGLRQISKERIWSEIEKILSYKNIKVVDQFLSVVGSVIFGENLLTRSEFFTSDRPEVILMAHGVSKEWFEKMPISKEAMKLVRFLSDFKLNNLNYDTLCYGKTFIQEHINLNNMKLTVPDVPKFPVSGADIPGKGDEIGRTLAKLKLAWCKSNFTMTEDELVRLI